MNQLKSTRPKHVCLLDALSRAVKAQGRGLAKKRFGYRKIRPTMTPERDEAADLSEVILQERSDADQQTQHKSGKKPKRILQFSDGVMEEYSSEDEVDTRELNKPVPQIDPKTLKWLPWAWYQTTWFGSKVLDGCDYAGEFLADFFGITSPKYQFEINEFYRLQALEKEMQAKQDLEMGGWNEKKRNNLISSVNTSTVEHN